MREREAGYTLVELLIVLALMGLISLAIAGGLRFGARTWEKTEQTVGASETARGGHAVLTSLLSRLYPRTPDAAQPQAAAFEGGADRMTFLADAAAPFPAEGVARFTLAVRRDRGTSSLLLTQESERGPSAKVEEVLFDNAARIVFSYAEVGEGVVTWTDTWTGRERMPALIRVRVAFPPGAGRWPDLIVRPAIDRAANCIYDPVSFECRRG